MRRGGRHLRFDPAGFFVLRTPLLPFDDFARWSDGLEAPSALDEPTRLEQALAADRTGLRIGLRALVARPAVREALFIGSPDLDASLEVWLRDPDSEWGGRIERALVRYFARMTGRATPFGLFAGCSVGVLGNETRLLIDQLADYSRLSRLDIGYLCTLSDTLARTPQLRKVLTYRPNSSLHRAGGAVRYIEARLDGPSRSYDLVVVEHTEYLAATLTRAHAGATADTLAAGLVGEDVTSAEATEYIGQLIDCQLLIPDLAPVVTGPEPAQAIVEQLRRYADASPAVECLDHVRSELAAIDASVLGASPNRYRAVAAHLATLASPINLSQLFVVDMIKPASATLGTAVLAEIRRGVEILGRLATRPRPDALTRFREAFLARYEDQEVPLLEALDEEVGVGFGSQDTTSPLLRELALPSRDTPRVDWGHRDVVLLGKLNEALRHGAFEIALDARDLEQLAEPEGRPPLPDAFAIMAAVAASSDTALSQGDFQIALNGATGLSGDPLIGRFCHASPTLRQHVERYMRAEESLRPDAIFAEIVHLPHGRGGNLQLRPTLRPYEIPYLGRPGAVDDQQIPASDLVVTVRGGWVVLRSRRLGREVVPRLTSPHDYTHQGNVGVYRFLCTLQGQGTARLAWDWGALTSAPFLPRVTTGRLVLARARWRMSLREAQPFGRGDATKRFGAIQAWRAERRVPRLVALTDGDEVLPVDLDNVLSVESFAHAVRGRQEATLVEVFPGGDQLCVRSPEGRFVHELVVPFLRVADDRVPQASARPHRISPVHPMQTAPRVFAPGSEWLYFKLYTGESVADHILCDVVAPVVRTAVDSGAVDRWFFVRHADPDWHLRVRFHGVPERLQRVVLPDLEHRLAPLLADGRVWRVQLDTYAREVERYGGPRGIVLAEQLFHADSDAVLELLKNLGPGGERADERWRLAVGGIDALLTDLGFDLGAKLGLVREARESFRREFRVDGGFKRRLSGTFVRERASLEALLNSADDDGEPLGLGVATLRQRSARLASVSAQAKALEHSGELTVPLNGLARSYVHMHVNRLVRADHRSHELVLYDFLARLYESRSARGQIDRTGSPAKRGDRSGDLP